MFEEKRMKVEEEEEKVAIVSKRIKSHKESKIIFADDGPKQAPEERKAFVPPLLSEGEESKRGFLR